MSGKGGAGKTTVAAALASLVKNAVFCDNDVDAADLHLIFKPQVLETHDFSSGSTASINQESCTNCGLCESNCRFDAIHTNRGGYPEVNPFQCEGCRLCERICPVSAITTKENLNNHWYVSDTRFGKLVHAKMGPGEENSGKLVSRIREEARDIAKEIKADFILNDGPPGIGCSVISSVTGTDLVVLVIEPTISGLHDAKRLVELVKSFKIRMCAIINKYDINIESSSEVEHYFIQENIQVIGRIPFDTEIVDAMVNEQSIVEFNSEKPLSRELKKTWGQIKNIF